MLEYFKFLWTNEEKNAILFLSIHYLGGYAMEYAYCCPFCGEVVTRGDLSYDSDYKYCEYCDEDIEPLLRSEHEIEYYQDVAKKRFLPYKVGNYEYSAGRRWKEILIEEVSQNPLFDKEKYEKRLKMEAEIDEERKIAEARDNAVKNSCTPKCPTCGSTHISKISGITRALEASFFGWFSPTARAQFRCNNCGYEW